MHGPGYGKEKQGGRGEQSVKRERKEKSGELRATYSLLVAYN